MHLNTGPNIPASARANPFVTSIQAGSNSNDLAGSLTAMVNELQPPVMPKIKSIKAKPPAANAAATLRLHQIDDGPRSAALVFEINSCLRMQGTELEVSPATLERRHGGAWSPLASLTAPSPAQLERMAKTLLAKPVMLQRASRSVEILVQDRDPLVTQFAQLVGLQTGRHRRTLLLLHAASLATLAALHRLKQCLAVPRPYEVLQLLPSMVEMPGHPALPAGHASIAFLLAELLGHIGYLLGRPDQIEFLRRVAARIAENRFIAGLHYPADNIAGAMLGKAMADLLIGSTSDKPAAQYSFRLPQNLSKLKLDASTARSFTLRGPDLEKAFSDLGASCVASRVVTELPLWNAAFAEALAQEWS
ncbi:MAG: phosphatase PAP2 family protein [Inhella sp.]